MKNQSKLKPSQVVTMRGRYAQGGVTLDELANEYHVARDTVWRAVTGQSHEDTPGPIAPRRKNTKRGDRGDPLPHLPDVTSTDWYAALPNLEDFDVRELPDVLDDLKPGGMG